MNELGGFRPLMAYNRDSVAITRPATAYLARRAVGLSLLSLLVGGWGLSGCNDAFMKQATADKTSAIASLQSAVDDAGNVSAEFDPTSGQTQVLKLTSGSLAGAAVAIPPGALAIPVSVVVGEGESLASSTFAQQIGLTDNTITASSSSVSFIPNPVVQATNPFTLAIPMSAASALALTEEPASSDRLVVMYRTIKVENGETSYLEGVIPREQITVSKDKVTFQTANFGIFQVGVAQTKVTEKIVKPAAQPPALIADAGNPLVGVWGLCEAVKPFPEVYTGSTTDKTGTTGSTSQFPTKSNMAQPTPEYNQKFLGMVATPLQPGGDRFTAYEGVNGLAAIKKIHDAAFWFGQLYVGGAFDNLANLPHTSRLGRLEIGPRIWGPVFPDKPLSTSVDAVVMSLASTGDRLFVGGRFKDGFGVTGATNIMALTRPDPNDMSKIAVQALGATLPTDCRSVSDVRVVNVPVNQIPTVKNLVAVCNLATPIPNTTPQLFRNKSRIVSLDLTDSKASWAAIGGDIDPGKDEPNPMSAIDAFDVFDGVAVAAVRNFATQTDTTSKLQVRRLDLTTGVWSDLTLPEAGVKFSLKLMGPYQLLLGGHFGADGKSLVEMISLSGQNSGGTTGTSVSPTLGGNLPPLITLLSTGSSSPVTVLSLDFIPPPAGQTTGGEERLLVGTRDDLQVYTMQIDPTTNQRTANLMSPASGEKPIMGEKSLMVVNYSDNTRAPGKLGSYFVVGSFPADQSPGCGQVEAWMPKSQVTLNDFVSGNVQLAANQAMYMGQDLKRLVLDAKQDLIPLVVAKLRDLPVVPNAEGRSLSLQPPPGCMFRQNGQDFMTWNLDFAFFQKIEPTAAIPERTCRVTTPFKIDDPAGSLAIICNNSTTAGTTGSTGTEGTTQWPSTEAEAMNYGEEFFGQARGNSYSRRESVRFTRSDFAHSVEYFKSADCTGELVATKTELGVYGLPPVDVDGTIPADVKMQKALGKIVGADWFKSDNKIDRAIASCGILNWQRGVERDLPSGKSCFTSGAIFPRFQVVGEELQVCGVNDKDIMSRPKDCSSVMVKFKRPPKR